jgi:hypothetical protein
MSNNLHPLHYEDLQKSGLSDETIDKAGINPPDEHWEISPFQRGGGHSLLMDNQRTNQD